ncbi:hypothetical protein NW762_013431 [Fusarium torreyae]|uniref:Cytochrome P450 monooxygenase n=1 Tax=Fusarium torreyae TaxID=1237075 RepID=A0A9W8VAE8_9HYPO|nr:hypothetical protein NW762_013431 [Fusarium torreyae]
MDSAPDRKSTAVALLSWVTSTPSRLVLVLVSVTLLYVGALVAMDYARVLRQRQSLPPGPFPWPIVGNHFQIKLPRPWLYMANLSKEYNDPMVTIWYGHKPSIVCNDIWTITDLCDKRANIYSSRPHMIMLGDSRNATKNDQAVLPYGDRWRYHRRLTHQAVGTQAVRSYRPFQQAEIKLLLRDLLTAPERYEKAIERYSVSIVSCIGFGRRVAEMDDVVAQMALKFMEGVDFVMPGLFIMESIPWLLDIPRFVYPAASKFTENGKRISDFFTSLSREASETSKEGSQFADLLVRESESQGLNDKEISFLTGNLIGGGVDTTASTTITFIFAMCAFPEVQKKAQAYIDKVVGERLPDWDDEPDLRYVRACVEETLRWRTVTILGGIPHAPIQDDIYRGYHIPKGTWITGNMWSIHRNPSCFPGPDVYRPERFMDRDQEPPFPVKKGHSAFGWGRRQCSGQPLAEQGLFLTFARLLWTFDMKPALRADGTEEKLDIFAFTESENMRPEPFRVRFIPRSESRKKFVLAEAKEARDFLTQFDSKSKVVMPDFV